MKKNQKLNKYSTNIQSIRIDFTWSCRLRPHNTLSQPCSYFTYSSSNLFQAISSVSPPNKQIRQKDETWAFDNHIIFSKIFRKRNRQTYVRFCKLDRLTAVGIVFSKNKIFQFCDLENETGDRFPITLVQPYSDFKTLLLKEKKKKYSIFYEFKSSIPLYK